MKWTLTRNGEPVDVSRDDCRLYMTSIWGRSEITDFAIEAGVVMWTWKGRDQHDTGVYGMVLECESNGMTCSWAKCEALRLVTCDCDADSDVVEADSDLQVATNGLSAYEVWLTQPGNSGKTMEDYLAWLREPATTAGEAADAGEAARKEAERLRETAEANRAEAEEQRAAEWALIKPEAARATEAANAAAKKADTAATAAEAATEKVEQLVFVHDGGRADSVYGGAGSIDCGNA